MRASTLLPTALALACLTGLAGCSGDDPVESDPGQRDRELAIDGGDEYAIGSGDEYVALGDSYTAAPLTGDDADDVGCGRSTNNYPSQIATATEAQLVDVSCAGARTEHVTEPFRTSADETVPPQIEAVGETTDLVTISLGGNDDDLFSELVVSCILASRGDRSGSPCADQDAAAGDESTATRLAELEKDLVTMVDRVERAAPAARVLLVGYPDVVPADEACELLPLAKGDYPFARGIVTGLNDAMRAAAKQSGASYLDVFSATEGHDICSAEPWIAGLRAENGSAAPLHPYVEEQEAVADLVLEVLQRG